MHPLHHFSVRRGRGSRWRAAGLAGWRVVCLPVVVCLACGGRSFLLLLGHDFARHGWGLGPDRGAWGGVPAQSRESGKAGKGKAGSGKRESKGAGICGGAAAKDSGDSC